MNDDEIVFLWLQRTKNAQNAWKPLSLVFGFIVIVVLISHVYSWALVRNERIWRISVHSPLWQYNHHIRSIEKGHQNIEPKSPKMGEEITWEFWILIIKLWVSLYDIWYSMFVGFRLSLLCFVLNVPACILINYESQDSSISKILLLSLIVALFLIWWASFFSFQPNNCWNLNTISSHICTNRRISWPLFYCFGILSVVISV